MQGFPVVNGNDEGVEPRGPMQEGEAAGKKPAARDRPRPIKSILHVDDENIQRFTMSRLLAACREDVTVVSAGDGKEGLDTMMQHEFDLVISDLEMPNMDGRDMIVTYRAWEAEARHPRHQLVVCCTGADDNDEELLKAGFDKVMRKPITKAKVAELVNGAASEA